MEDGLAALGKLLDYLADVATPAGPTPREFGTSELVQITCAGPDPGAER